MPMTSGVFICLSAQDLNQTFRTKALKLNQLEGDDKWITSLALDKILGMTCSMQHSNLRKNKEFNGKQVQKYI